MSFINTIEKQTILENAFSVMKNPSKKIYIFDGLIGAGKTTLIKRLYEHMTSLNMKVHAIFEPVDIWNTTGALKYFYDDVPTHSYEFQTFTYITRIERVLKELHEHSNCDIFLLERSIWSDRYIFVELLKPFIGEVRMQMYNQWCDLWMYLMPLKPTKWILLDTSLDETMRRVNIRSRDGENKVDEDYQRNLYAKHIEFYHMLKGKGENTLCIPETKMNADFKTNDDLIKEIFTYIMPELITGENE
jgi:deoxyadenosine/deoxycytidine kinase